MNGLFTDDEIEVERRYRRLDTCDFEFRGRGGLVVAAARQRAVPPLHSLRHLLTTRRTVPRAEYDVEDPGGNSRLVIVKSPGVQPGFEVSVSRADGTALGRASSTSRLLSPFPDIDLTDASGSSLGSGRGKAEITYVDQTGTPCATTVAQWPGEAVSTRFVYQLTFEPDATELMRALVVGASIGANLSRYA